MTPCSFLDNLNLKSGISSSSLVVIKLQKVTFQKTETLKHNTISSYLVNWGWGGSLSYLFIKQRASLQCRSTRRLALQRGWVWPYCTSVDNTGHLCIFRGDLHPR